MDRIARSLGGKYVLPMTFELIPLNVAEFFLYFATVMSIVSMIQYYNLNKKLIIDDKSK